jgi:hypothetical protein
MLFLLRIVEKIKEKEGRKIKYRSRKHVNRKYVR